MAQVGPDTCSVFSAADPDIAGIGVRTAYLAQNILLIIFWSFVRAPPSFEPVLRITVVTAFLLHITGLIAIVRGELHYYHAAIVTQLIMSTFVPLGCLMVRPGLKQFGWIGKGFVALDCICAAAWSVGLLLKREGVKMLEMQCREMWIQQICGKAFADFEGCQRKLASLLPVNLQDPDRLNALGANEQKLLLLGDKEVLQFYRYQIVVYSISIFLVLVVPVLIYFYQSQKLHLPTVIGQPMSLLSLLLATLYYTIQQSNAIDHFHTYSDDSEARWGFGQTSAIVSIVYFLVELGKHVREHGTWDWVRYASATRRWFLFVWGRLKVYWAHIKAFKLLQSLLPTIIWTFVVLGLLGLYFWSFFYFFNNFTHILTHITATVYGTSWSPHIPKDSPLPPPPPPINPELGISAYQPTITIKAFLSIRYFLITVLGIYVTLACFFLLFLLAFWILIKVATMIFFAGYYCRIYVRERRWRQVSRYAWKKWTDFLGSVGKGQNRPQLATQEELELGQVEAPPVSAI